MSDPIYHSSPSINKKEIARVLQVLKSGHLEDGEVVGGFESGVKNYLGKKYALAVSSGFAAIHLALKGYGIGKGDEVIIPSYTCAALLNPVLLEGATPVIADVEANGFNLSLEDTKRKITARTRAIILPYIFGYPADIEKFMEPGIPVIEDCAQSLGGSFGTRRLGSFSETAICSFYATKMITSADGGMLLTDNEEVYQAAMNYRYYGHKKMHRFVAYNYKMNNVAAAIGIEQLNKLDAFIAKRKRLAARYDKQLKQISGLQIQFNHKKESCHYRYPVFTSKRDELKNALRLRDIHCGYGVLEGMHQLLNLDDALYPNTTHHLGGILSLPLYPDMKMSDVDRVAHSIREIMISSTS